jgi:germination protein M
MQRKIFCVLILCFLTAVFTSGCSILQKLGLGDVISDELLPASSLVMEEEEAIKLKDKKPVKLYFADKENVKLRAEIRYINASDMKGNAGSQATILIKELIKGPGKGVELESTIPGGTKLLSDVAVENRTAIVNVSKEFVEKHPGGKDEEKLTIYSVVNTLTELREIEKVIFKVEGETRALYKENFKFDKPFPRSTSIISEEPPLKSRVEEDEEDRIEDKEERDNGENSESKENEQSNQEKADEKADETFEDMNEEEILE